MVKLKRFMVGVLAGVMTLAMAVPVFAANGINAEEQKLINYAQEKASELGVADSKVYKTNYNEAVGYLKSNDVDLTAAEVDTLLKATDSVVSQAKDAMGNSGSLVEWAKANPAAWKSLQGSIQSELKTAAKKVGITLSFDGKSGVSATANGKTVTTASKSTVKQSGMAANGTVAVVAFLAIALTGCGVVIKKQKLFA